MFSSPLKSCPPIPDLTFFLRHSQVSLSTDPCSTLRSLHLIVTSNKLRKTKRLQENVRMRGEQDCDREGRPVPFHRKDTGIIRTQSDFPYVGVVTCETFPKLDVSVDPDDRVSSDHLEPVLSRTRGLDHSSSVDGRHSPTSIHLGLSSTNSGPFFFGQSCLQILTDVLHKRLVVCSL